MKKMEQLANIKAFLCMVFGAIVGGFVNLIGGWSEDLEKEQQVGKRGTE